ncbi:hypothetical protein ILUMI_10064 [Ignelater luminosus]|uniref:PiggyBac transposable element-derived protein domain-containing protein n=1 Tax=Ignelater luminosus TaxID=2038154 RepID=A0A8K0D2R4_IGNLU|nr:hypothetical protein ILUMI_10064 [Ignelater luminosus]
MRQEIGMEEKEEETNHTPVKASNKENPGRQEKDTPDGYSPVLPHRTYKTQDPTVRSVKFLPKVSSGALAKNAWFLYYQIIFIMAIQAIIEKISKGPGAHKFFAPPVDSEDEYLSDSDSNSKDLEPDSELDADSAKSTPIWQDVEEDDVDLWQAVDYFKIFFSDNQLEHIVKQSNLYCVQQNPNKALDRTVAKLEQFIGVTMSIFDLHRTRNYWTEKFRLSQERHADDFDRLYKIRPLLDRLVSKFQSIPLQGQMFCIDEQIIPFKEKSTLKCYMFMVCIIYNFDVYTGKIVPKPYHLDIRASENIVRQLPNIPSNQKLYKRGIDAIGTIRLPRFPGCTFTSDADLKKKSRRRYEEKESAIENANMRTIKWFDNRGVILATTFSSAEPLPETERWDKEEKKKVAIQEPYAVNIYNKFMGGVDLLDRLIAYYRIHVRLKKYYMTFFTDLITINTWNWHRKDCKTAQCSKNKPKDQLYFKTSAAKSLYLLEKST